MAKYKISIVICTFNGEKFIENQISSILFQTRKADEILILDDNSCDNTFELINNYDLKKNNITMIKNQNNLGYIKNFEKGIMLANHEIIVLCDQDDVWKENKLEKIEAYFQKNDNKSVVFSNGDLIDENGKIFKGKSLWDSVGFTYSDNYNEKKLLKLLMRKNIVTGATIAFRKEFRNIIIPINPDFVHDIWISKLAALNFELGTIPECLIKYRIHENQNIGINKSSIKNSIKKNTFFEIMAYEKNINKLQILKKQILLGIEVNGWGLNLIDKKISFLHSRINYSNYLLIRIFQVFYNIINGNYSTFTYNKYNSILKDLLKISKREQ